MKLVKLIIENYRGYTCETEICFNDLTVIIGKNDIGKSTILEAMDLFFYDGKGTIRIDKADVNIYMAREGNYDTVITAVFADLPEHIIILSLVSIIRNKLKMREL
ncbi:MAG: AAA family ATPase [Erysipelotrichaceae bacterium]|nr:AAA family ATPase [Erysipelotrichaceae bacterium]